MRERSNPSIGLSVWGPLVPASDCKPCLATLTGLQFGAGALLWALPGRRPPPTRGKWANRGVNLAGVVVGAYLMFYAVMEGTRLMLPYDPWVDDAAKARKREDMLSPPRSALDPRTWWYKWFGPSNYRAIPWSEWQQRTTAYLDRAEQVRPQIEHIVEARRALVEANKSIAVSVLTRLQNGTIVQPELSVAEMKELDGVYWDDDVLKEFDEADLSNVDLWEGLFEDSNNFSCTVVPRSTIAFLDGTKIAPPEELKSQSVNYMPVPESLRRF